MSDLPRLLLCSFDVIPGPSGSSRRLTEYLKALPDRFSVVVLSAKTPDHSHIEKYQGARLLRVPVGSGDLASRIQTFERAVRRQLDSEEYALAHFTDPFGGYALCELKADYGYRLIYEAQTFPSQELRYTHPQTEGDKRFLARIRRQELFCLMNADLVITGSQTTRTYIQTLGASTEQIRVIRSPVDLVPYTPDVLGAPDGQPMRLMYLGSQAGWQGLPILMRAMALAMEQGAEVKLTLVGARHPDWQPHLEDLAKELGIQEHVEFQAPVAHDDLVKVLALGDVGVMPLDDVDRNRLQGGPLAKVSEYFAAGRPVLVADLPVTRELLPSSAVLFHTAGDARSLADSIVELAQDVPRRLAMGREARAFAEQELDAGLIRGKLLDIYDELLGKQTVVGTPSEMPVPTMTGTPTNRLSQIKPPEGGGSSGKGSRGGKSEKGKSKKKAAAKEKEKEKEDLPLVVGQVLSESGIDDRLVKTELDTGANEPPVVMGLPLRDGTPAGSKSRDESSGPTPIVRPPAGLRRDEPEEPPTSIVTMIPPKRDNTPHTPTPIVRSPQGPPNEVPPAASPRPIIPTQEEEPPTPTPIVPMKFPGASPSNGSTRPEQGATRTPVVPPAPKTGTRSALQEPTRGQEPAEKSRTPSLPPLTRAPPPSETRGPPPRLDPIAAPNPQAPSPTEPAAPPSIRVPPPPEPVALPRIRVPPPPEPTTPLPGRTVPAPEPVTPPPPRAAPAPAPEPVTPPPPRTAPAPAPEPVTPPPPRASPAPAPEPATPPPPRASPAPAPEPATPPPLRSSPAPAPEPATPPPSRAASAPEPVTPPSVRTSPAPEPQTPASSRPPPLEPATPPPLRKSPPQENAGPPPLRPTPPPLRPSGVFPPVVARPPVVQEEEPEELSEEEAQEISEEAAVDTTPTPRHARPTQEEPEELDHDEVEEADASDDDLEEADASEAVEASDDDLEEADAAEAVDASDDDLEEADAAEAVDASDDDLEEADASEAVEASDDPSEKAADSADPIGGSPQESRDMAVSAQAPQEEQPVAEPPHSALDPWFAQVAHGYCPPEGAQFARHTPPTNFPGRDEPPSDPTPVPPSPRAQGSTRSKGS
ncbi:glycosyltransferase family 4 protein [Hyalangium versicolor]|uniref:glycosyltransferase family 4 protein n=1 Tax=Hyalangium versicolor TaxID=2861190 RepID=UPI001CCFA35D|nr:glycosyltransferase family 4 protein [Hyalangium versicolor]